MKSLRYAIVGTGALGGYYGGKLAKSGREVHFLLHSDYDTVIKNGLIIESVNGTFQVNPVNAYHQATDMPPADVVLVCLKTTANKDLAHLLPPLLKKGTCVILLQNGLGMENRLMLDLPDINCAGGLAFIASSKFAPGHITHMDYGQLTLGSFKGDNQALLEQVCTDFTLAGVEALLTTDLIRSRWKKLVWNIPFNGLSVVMNTTTNQLMDHPSTVALIKDLMTEVVGGANALGLTIKTDFVQNMLETTKTMKPYAPSMKLDYDNKRQLEIEAIYSNPLTAAAQAGYAMPKVRMLEQQLLFIMKHMNDH